LINAEIHKIVWLFVLSFEINVQVRVTQELWTTETGWRSTPMSSNPNEPKDGVQPSICEFFI